MEKYSYIENNIFNASDLSDTPDTISATRKDQEYETKY